MRMPENGKLPANPDTFKLHLDLKTNLLPMIGYGYPTFQTPNHKIISMHNPRGVLPPPQDIVVDMCLPYLIFLVLESSNP